MKSLLRSPGYSLLTSPKRVPFLGSYFINEIPPEDNVSGPKLWHKKLLHQSLTADSPSKLKSRGTVGDVRGAVIENGLAGLV